jgi:hypothetical protein
MKRTILIIAGLVILGIIVVVLLVTRQHGPASSGTATTTFPGSGTSGVDVGNNTQVQLLDGTKAEIPDFSKTDTRENASATNGYEVAGANTEDFQILYYPQDSYFLVSLLAEPLGETRRAAEAALRAKLKIPDAEICKLNLEVRTSFEVNPTYGGDHLGLSFCPGAVKLP